MSGFRWTTALPAPACRADPQPMRTFWFLFGSGLMLVAIFVVAIPGYRHVVRNQRPSLLPLSLGAAMFLIGSILQSSHYPLH